jgi:hypothetical protein
LALRGRRRFERRALERAGVPAESADTAPALERIEHHDELSRALAALSDE